MTSLVSITSIAAMHLVALTLPGPSLGTTYHPGIQPKSYNLGDYIEMRVDALTSTRTQISVDHYSLPLFCMPEEGPKKFAQTLGENLEGSRIQSSPYRVRMAVDMYCEKVCQVTLSAAQVARVKMHIDQRYHMHLILDQLPSAVIGSFNNEQFSANGFAIGTKDAMPGFENDFYIFNHLNFVIDFHRTKDGGYRVVEFAVQPLSIQHAEDLSTCPYRKHLGPDDIKNSQKLATDEPIITTYGVVWRDSSTPYSERWSIYLSNDNWVPMQIHMYSMMNSLIVVVLLTAMLLVIWVRANRPPSEVPAAASVTIRQALSTLFSSLSNQRYASVSGTEEASSATNAPESLNLDEQQMEQMERQRQELRNWRKLRGDVFRPPSSYPGILCAFIGNGAQLMVSCLVVVSLAATGQISQAATGSLTTAFLVCYNLSGVIGGYVSYRLYASFGATLDQIKRCIGMMAVIFPGSFFASFVLLNLCLWSRGSTSTLCLLDMLILLLLWFCGLVLSVLGAYIGSLHSGTIEYPTHTNPIPREIPQQKLWKRPFITLPVSGILPFGALFVEMFFALSSLWSRQYYYVFEVALVVYLLALWTSSATACIMVYFQLALENHRWWWFSFFSGGSVAFYFCIYGYFYAQNLELEGSFVTWFIYILYMFWISAAMFLVFGSIGSLSALIFLFKLYGSLDHSDIGEALIDRVDDNDSNYIVLDTMNAGRNQEERSSPPTLLGRQEEHGAGEVQNSSQTTTSPTHFPSAPPTSAPQAQHTTEGA